MLDNGITLNSYIDVAKDRKSTRLNSSHLVISYAVFCLKKKKITFCYSQSTNMSVERNLNTLTIHHHVSRTQDKTDR